MVQLLYIVASLYVLLCPYTKVEESFNIQAFHDILYHQYNITQYDHNEFPGVVPRSFIGPLAISLLSAPIVGILHISGLDKFWMQYVVRLTLALTVIAAWSRLRNALQKQFGSTFAWWFTVLTVTQYHFMFYMSRPLPNIMTLPLVLLSFEGWISGRNKLFLISAGASIIIFRSELAMLFGLFLIMDLYFKKIDIQMLLKIVIPAGAGLVLLTVVIDSIFWQRLLWPEAEVFWYNTFMNKSANWGTSPFLWYLYSALPRGLGPSLVLIPVGVYLDKRVVQFAAPAFVYVLLYSILPHKELRFIIYVFPLLNMASAAACSYIFIRRTKAPVYELLFWGIVVLIVGNILLSAASLLVALTNYPGGVAISRFHKFLRNEPFVHLHISNLAAQTGVSRFTQLNNQWQYNKNESLQPEQLQEFTHLLVEAKSKYSPNLKAFAQSHVVLDSIESFSHIAMNYRLVPPLKIKTKPALFILERKDFRDYPYGHSIQTIENTSSNMDEDSSQKSVEEYSQVEEEIVSTLQTPDDIEEFTDENKQDDEDLNDESLPEVAVRSKEEYNTKENADDVDDLLVKPKKVFEDLKLLRKEKKKKAIAKIKSETRKEVVASAKEKLKEIMKRHRYVAEELSENIISDNMETPEESDGRGDIPDEIIEQINEQAHDNLTNENFKEDENENSAEVLTSRTNENIDVIVEEVIVRLIDRKIYDDKTKPEDIKPEDRKVIQKIVEEVLAEKMNYTNADKSVEIADGI